MSLRSWRRRLRLFKAVELLGGRLGVTQAALEPGYGTASAFIYAFRTEMGCSPQAYMWRHALAWRGVFRAARRAATAPPRCFGGPARPARRGGLEAGTPPGPGV